MALAGDDSGKQLPDTPARGADHSFVGVDATAHPADRLRVAVVAGEMLNAARSHAPGYFDIAIAATAKVHDMTVLTRNERYFVPLAVKVIDPFTHLP